MSQRIEKSLEHAFYFLYFSFIVLTLWAGVDKIFNISQTWTRYLSPLFLRLAPAPPETVLFIVGVIELAAGAMIMISPRRGALALAVWLLCVILNLMTIGVPASDILICYIVLFCAAVTFYKLSVLISLT